MQLRVARLCLTAKNYTLRIDVRVAPPTATRSVQPAAALKSGVGGENRRLSRRAAESRFRALGQIIGRLLRVRAGAPAADAGPETQRRGSESDGSRIGARTACTNSPPKTADRTAPSSPPDLSCYLPADASTSTSCAACLA